MKSKAIADLLFAHEIKVEPIIADTWDLYYDKLINRLKK